MLKLCLEAVLLLSPGMVSAQRQSLYQPMFHIFYYKPPTNLQYYGSPAP